MKTIVTMAHARTGSTFLTNFFIPETGLSYNAREFYGSYLPNQYDQLKYIYFKNNIPVPDSYKLFLDKIIYILAQTGHHKQSFQKLIEDTPNICNLDMLGDVIKTLTHLNYECFFYKLIHNAYLDGRWYDFVRYSVKHADTILINYRESILDTYISFQKATKTNIWVAKTYTEEYDFCKITWNKKEFEEFSLRYKNYYYHILNILKIANKKYETITYEELCNSNDKIKLISEKININKHIRKESTTIKQSTSKSIEDNFVNVEEFQQELKDLENSKLFLKL